MPLSYDFSALKNKVDSLNPNGGTNQPIGIAWAWQSLTSTAPLNAPAEEANYTYKKVLIVMSDGLNTQDRWPAYGNGQTQFSGQIDARQRILCDNIKAAGITIYAMHVNTDNDPTSAVLQYCASTPDKFFHRHLGDPDHGRLQLDRKLAVEAAGRADNSSQVRRQEKSPAMTAGLFDSWKAALRLVRGGRGELRDQALERLEGLLGEIGIEPGDLLRTRPRRSRRRTSRIRSALRSPCPATSRRTASRPSTWCPRTTSWCSRHRRWRSPACRAAGWLRRQRPSRVALCRTAECLRP